MKLGWYYLLKDGVKVGEAEYTGGVKLQCLLYVNPSNQFPMDLFILNKKFKLKYIKVGE